MTRVRTWMPDTSFAPAPQPAISCPNASCARATNASPCNPWMGPSTPNAADRYGTSPAPA